MFHIGKLERHSAAKLAKTVKPDSLTGVLVVDNKKIAVVLAKFGLIWFSILSVVILNRYD